MKKGATKEYLPDPGKRYALRDISTWSNTKYPLVHTCDKKCQQNDTNSSCERLYISKIPSNIDGLTYVALCVKFPKGIPIGTLIALETALRTLGTERVSTPSVTPKVMYGIGVTDTLVAAQMEYNM